MNQHAQTQIQKLLDQGLSPQYIASTYGFTIEDANETRNAEKEKAMKRIKKIINEKDPKFNDSFEELF